MERTPDDKQPDQETRDQENEEQIEKGRDKDRPASEDEETEEAAEDTFPASDPPAW